MNNDNTKVCTKCKVEKSLSEFHKDKNKPLGVQSACKTCRNLANKKYNNLNQEKVALGKSRWRENNPEYGKIWYQNNKEKVILSSRNWRKNNPEKAALNKKNWIAANPDKKSFYNRNWEKNNPEKVNEKAHRRRTRKYENGVFKVNDKFLKKLYSSPCANCGSMYMVEADHIIPIARGGRHSEGNMQPMCRACNSSKGAKFMYEWKRDKNDICQ